MPLRDDLLTPIAGSEPAGVNLRYDPIYDKIKEARREDLDVPQGGWQTALKTADWPLVIKLAGDALATRSKDLQLAAWLTEASLKRNGFSGLREGLELLSSLIDGFWDTLYPELEDGDAEMRAAPLEWVAKYLDDAIRTSPLTAEGYTYRDYETSRLVGYESDPNVDMEARKKAIAAGKPTAEDFDRQFDATPKRWYQEVVADLKGSLEALSKLDRIADERFADVAPNFSSLRTLLEEVKRTATQLLDKKRETDPDPPEEEESPDSGESESAEAEGSADAGEASSGKAGSGVVAAVPTSAAEAATRIASAARFLRSANPSNPAPYLMLRGFRWGELRAATGELNPRLLEAPPTEIRTRLKSFLLAGKWKELLEAGEEVMAAPYGRGWIDLQRYSVSACNALGGPFEPLGLALRSALRSLLQDIPELPGAAMMDDSPAANAETQRWLRDEGLISDDAPDELTTSKRDPYERAMERVRAGDPHGGVQVLMRHAQQERSPRERFLRRLQAATIMVDSGLENIALPMLQEMSEQIDALQLEQWESGETIARSLGLLYRCLNRLEYDPSMTQPLFLRVTRLDPLQAITLSSGAGNGGTGD